VSSLLERTRRINRLIQNAAGYSVNFGELAEVLSGATSCHVFIVAKNGKVLGQSFSEAVACDADQSEVMETGFFPRASNEELLRIHETSANMDPENDLAFLRGEAFCGSGTARLTVVPVYGGGERLATLLLVKTDGQLADDDLILGEYGAAVVGMEILRSKSEKVEEESRKRAAVQMALDTLSYSEQKAVEHIFDELSGDEGLLVASKIADRVGITRSVIVNALRKFESAGVIESRSLGMKGTYIRVLNDKLFDELDKPRAR
jgi:transcriptional pleiotropic repressor